MRRSGGGGDPPAVAWRRVVMVTPYRTDVRPSAYAKRWLVSTAGAFVAAHFSSAFGRLHLSSFVPLGQKDRILMRLISDSSRSPEVSAPADVPDSDLLDVFSRTSSTSRNTLGQRWWAFASVGASTTPTIRLRPCWGPARV